MTEAAVHPVDEKIPLPRLAALGFQHVLVMYARAIAVPLIIGRALKHMAHGLHLLASGILLTTISAVLLNMFFNGAKGSVAEARTAAMQAEGGH